ncbi:phospholipase [Campylobacter sp. MIT 99-7217]|uniref:phospholipase A n=1 Tax=Campylobacter sp. MIT 99-7217 TaxID=535091 RepID=UPI001159EC7D|nr:phospholipase A [Campylobacter sp. MIT 99-7217]TQR33853.1 phospholipase [Campylobacter sp. MIT 99-7217]
MEKSAFKAILITCFFISTLFAKNLDTTPLAKEEKDFKKYLIMSYKGETSGLNLFGISIYNMNYFLPLSHNFEKMNSYDQSEVKFQISIKKALFENLFNLNETYYFAYTQTAWWQLYRYSSPFREINFKPEFFMDIPLEFDKFEYLKSIKFGFLHSSNGKDNTSFKSRSWNRVYASSVFMLDRLVVAPRIWYRIPEKKSQDDNPNITNYMGNFDFTLAYLGKNFLASSVFRNNLNFIGKNRTAWELNIGSDILGNGIFWHLQYFVGYGESLIDYNKFSNRISAGFLIAY